MVSYLGNMDLLQGDKIGFLASRTVSPSAVLPILEWAKEISADADKLVIGGFQSLMEREVLDILLQGRCGIIIVLNRGIYRQVPEECLAAYSANRLLFISLLPPGIRRPSVAHAQARNQFIASTATHLVLACVTPSSSLHPLSLQFSNKISLSF